MQRPTLVRLGLWLLAAGNAAWLVKNAAVGHLVNVLTDLLIIAGCALAALALGRALDGVGPGPWRAGLLVVAVAHFLQNMLNAFDGVDLPDEWTLFAVMLGSIAFAVGALRWQADGWNPGAAPWLMAGMLAFALEPLYYFLRYAWFDPWQSGYAPGILLVVAGTLTAAWALRPGEFDVDG